ncbi:MAG TPA: cytochrome c peroxidase [Bacteroidia bacterium]|jgi:cytochrome c peroxidase|nr:cytochrome c peroxidase [Bacteroidia bacterium]
MKRKLIYFFVFPLFFLLLLAGFIADNKYFVISQKDVEFKIPQGFPKPFYDFKNNKPTPAGFVLGRKLFYDPILSKDSSISCGFCHQRIAGFAHIDHALSHGINGLIGKRNVPPLENLAWSNSFMWDGRINHLEVQPLAPITNPIEMNETIEHIIKKLQQNKDYVSMFKTAFNDSVVNSRNTLKALAQFTGLMISANSRYDKYMRGEDTFSMAELSGLQLFRDNCAQCHKEPLFTDNTFRNTGLPMDTNLKDSGVASSNGDMKDFMKFKVPTLRNIEMTYPYMHDGRFRTLKQVMDHYTKKFSPESHADPILIKGIQLTELDKADIIAFLKTLTDQTFLHDRRFADPSMHY